MSFPSMLKINQKLHDLLRHKKSFICYERTTQETGLKSFVIACCHFDPQFTFERKNSFFLLLLLIL